MTPSQLESRIKGLRNSLRRMLALHGFSWVLGLVVPLVILACLADWLFQLDSVIRAALLVAMAGGALWLGYRRILRPLFVRFADLDIAMRIEERWPGLNDRLASTIQFLHLDSGDPRHGSPALREATVRKAVEEASAIDFRQVIEPKPVLRALLAASSAILVGVILVLLAPGTARIAVKRLFVPFSATSWPRQTHLALDEGVTTLKVARGDSFVLSVRVRQGDKIPESAQATYQFADGDQAGEPLRSVEGGEFRGRIESVTQPFRFSVSAGDDSSSIRDVPVKVVPPPTLKSLVLRLKPPAYTGMPEQVLAPGLTQLRALLGTQLELEALASKPLAHAELRVGEGPSGGALAFDESRTRFKTALTVKNNFNFWFDLKDTEGFKNREAVRYEVRGFADEAPRVVIEEPKTDRDVPPEATVPIRVILDDDFGLHSGGMVYRLATGDSEPRDPVAIPLWTAPEPGHGPALDSFIKHQEVGHEWLLAPLKLPVGTVITFHAEALDFDTIKGPKLGKSREIRLRIVSKEDALRQFDDGRRELREELARVLTMQKQAIAPVENAIRSLEQTRALPQAQRDDLNNAGMIQRQVGGRINNRDDGVGARMRRSLDDLKNFKLDSPEAQKQMEGMLAQLNVIRDQHLGPAEQGISRASKSLGENAPKSQERAPETANDGSKPNSPDQAPGKSAETAKAQSSRAPDSKSREGGESRPKAGSSQANEKGEASAKTGERGDTSKQAGSSKQADSSGTSAKGKSAAGDTAKDSGKSENGQPSPERSPGQAPTPADREKAGAPSARSELAEAKTNQKAIAAELQKMLDSLSEFETYRGVVKDAQEVLKQHEQTMKQTAEAAEKPDMIGKPLDALSPDQKAELGNLSSRQSQVGKSLQNLQERMGEMARRMDESDPLASSAMREAVQKTEKAGTAGKLGEAADQLEKNQMGKARTRQEQARDELRDMVDAIQNRRERELSRLVKELKNAEKDLAKTRASQAQNLKKTREAQRNPNAQERKDQLKQLAKEQAEIRKNLERQLQRLAKLSADRAARAGENAKGRMEQAQGRLDQDDGEEGGKQQEEALADLEDAQEELEQARREAEEQLAVEQLARMGDRLKSLAERQEKIVSETVSYDALRQKAEGRLSVAQRAGVKGLGQVQIGLKEETADLTENLDGAPVFALTLRRASENMQKVADRLLELKTDKPTEEAARAASDRFKQLLESLKADAGAGQGGGGGGGGGGGAAAGGNGDGIPPTAQLKMLKSLQKEINDRTESFDELRRRNKQLSPEQNRELQRLGEEQGVLADLVRDLTRPKRDDGEE